MCFQKRCQSRQELRASGAVCLPIGRVEVQPHCPLAVVGEALCERPQRQRSRFATRISRSQLVREKRRVTLPHVRLVGHLQRRQMEQVEQQLRRGLQDLLEQ